VWGAGSLGRSRGKLIVELPRFHCILDLSNADLTRMAKADISRLAYPQIGSQSQAHWFRRMAGLASGRATFEVLAWLLPGLTGGFLMLCLSYFCFLVSHTRHTLHHTAHSLLRSTERSERRGLDSRGPSKHGCCTQAPRARLTSRAHLHNRATLPRRLWIRHDRHPIHLYTSPQHRVHPLT
jgi:hypothetical protein